MPVSGLPISCATPAASRPTEANRSWCATWAARSFRSVRSSTSTTTPAVSPAVLPGSRTWLRLSEKARSVAPIWRCTSSCDAAPETKASTEAGSAPGSASSRAPTASCAPSPLWCSSARFQMTTSRSGPSAQTPSGRSRSTLRR